MNSLPALRFSFLTPIYDWFLHLTMPVEQIRSAILQHISPSAVSIIDFGCGTGELLVRLGKSHPNATIVGLDPDESALKIARKKTAHLGNIQIRRLGDEIIPFPSQACDVLVCSLVLHHLKPNQLKDALAEFHRVLRPDGLILVLDWSKPSGAIQTLLFNTTRIYDGWERTRVFAENHFPKFVRAAGFSRIESIEFIPTTFGKLTLFQIQK